MRIWILVKAPGRLKEPLARREWEIPEGIGNLRELVTALVEASLLALEDGLVRIYRNGEALEDPDAPLKLDEGDELLLLRLSFLAGRLW